jgi:hypothetical protein
MKILKLFKSKKSNEIGKFISWKNSVDMIFKIIDFDTNGTTINELGQIKANSLTKPYGYLKVENPEFGCVLKLPITHKDDFFLASSIFSDPNFVDIEKNEDFLVTYRPKIESPNGLAGIHHALHYSITPSHTLEKYYRKYGNQRKLDVLENIFVVYSWSEINVQINKNPEI